MKIGGIIMKTKLFDTDDYVLEYSLKSNQEELKITGVLLKHNIEEIILPESIDKMPVTGIKLRKIMNKKMLYIPAVCLFCLQH